MTTTHYRDSGREPKEPTGWPPPVVQGPRPIPPYQAPDPDLVAIESSTMARDGVLAIVSTAGWLILSVGLGWLLGWAIGWWS